MNGSGQCCKNRRTRSGIGSTGSSSAATAVRILASASGLMISLFATADLSLELGKKLRPQPEVRLSEIRLCEVRLCDLRLSEVRLAESCRAEVRQERLKRDSRLQIKLYQEAMGTPCNTAIAIFLAKNWLGMADRPEVQVITNVNPRARWCSTRPPKRD
jgi:hypothetical protein